MKRMWFVVLWIFLLGGVAFARVQGDDPNAVIVMEAELYDALLPPADPCALYEFVFDTANEGYVYTGYMQGVPAGGGNIYDDLTQSPRLDFNVEINEPGTYYVWVRAYAKVDENSLHMGINGDLTFPEIDVRPFDQWNWENGEAFEVSEPGVVTINVWMREAGACVDKLLVTGDPDYEPEGIEAMDSLAIRMQSDDPNNPNGMVAIEAELYASNVPPADANEGFEWVFDNNEALAGFALEGYMQNLPAGANIKSELERSPRLDYEVDIMKPGTYYFWLRGYAKADENSLHIGVNGELVDENFDVRPFEEWVWKNGGGTTIEVDEPGLVTINVWMRESGACVDKLVLTMDPNYVPDGTGPRDPLVGGITLYIPPKPVITAAPVDEMTFGVDDANNVVLATINGISTQDLILGTTLSDRGVMDDFVLERDYDNDIDGVFITTFNVAVTHIFIVEKDGNDSGYYQPIDANGDPIGGPLDFDDDSYSEKIEGINGEGDDMSGTVITAETPIYGIEIWASGLDPYSISALAYSPVVRPLESMEVNDPNVEEPSEDIPILVTALNGIPVEELILGTTTARIGQQERADNFDVSSNPGYTARTNDDNPPKNLVITIFDVPVSQVFVLEKDGDDDCIVTLLDVNGQAVGPEIPFEKSTWTKIQTSEWVIAGISITPKAPIYGILIYSTGVDIISVSAVPALAQ